ncbi:MAG: sodium-dependent transporter [Muribaculaceae bacterium]|nr:sodium-dependent transporter [Muribaculaceae bacterium]
MSERAVFATRIGAIAATVGSAVGLGNIWRFPYEAGQHGGGAFLLIYLACVLVMGIPVIVAEFVIGRASRKNVCGALRALSPWRGLHFFGYLCVLASLMIMSFYSVVCGWILEYIMQAVRGGMTGHTSQQNAEMFAQFVQNPWRSVMWTVLFLLLNYLILRRGLKRGIERLSNVLMPLLAVLLLAFCLNSLFMPQVWQGLSFLFTPDFSQISPRMVVGAMGQAFFSLSVGLSCLLTYASYFKENDSLLRNATMVAVFDTLVAILAGVMIFPAVFSYGVAPEAGPKLIFEVLPSIFQQMPVGGLWAVMFFALLFVAAITSTISVSEASIAFFCEEWGMSRNRASLLNTVVSMIFGSLCALSFGVMSGFTIAGKTLFELFDYVASNVFLPVGGMFFCIFVGWLLDRKLVKDQLTNHGTLSPRMLKPLIFCVRYVAPAAILAVFLYGIL